MCDWFIWKILNSCLNGLVVVVVVGWVDNAPSSLDGLCGGEVMRFDILSLISCFSAARRLTLMRWKDAALTAHQHIRVQSPLAQDSSGLGIIHSEKMKWRWACLTALLVSHLEKKNEVTATRTGNYNGSEGESAWAWDRENLRNVENKNNTRCGMEAGRQ